MDRTVIEFINALRGAEVRVSTSESLDVMHTFQLLGYANKNQLRMALSLVIPKSEEEKNLFEEVFDQFFSFHRFQRMETGGSQRDPGAEQGSIELTSLTVEQLMDPQSEVYSQQGTFAGELAAGGGALREARSPLGRMLLSGDQSGLGISMSQAAREVGVSGIKMLTQKGLYGRRIMMAMGLVAMEQEMESLAHEDDHEAKRLAGRLRKARDLLREEIKDYVVQQFLLYAEEHKRQLRESTMRQVKLQHLHEFKNVQLLVRKMAKRLAALHGRRRKVDIRGNLDVRNTLRKNIVHDGILFEPQWRSKRIDRPKVMAICDVSGSVSAVARFLLMFLYSLTEVLPRVRAFAFSSDLGEVTDLFDDLPLEQAIEETLSAYGMGSTNYGSAFLTFKAVALSDVDHHTTVIILGDARNNYGDARADILKEISGRAKQVIWLNPEGRPRWNTGDAVMAKYQPYCTMAEECNSLNHLERVVSRLLRRAAS